MASLTTGVAPRWVRPKIQDGWQAHRYLCIIRELAACGLVVLADKGYHGAGDHVLTPYRGRNKTPYRGRNKPASQRQANRAHAPLRSPGEHANARSTGQHVEAQVEGGAGVGKGTDGDEVDAGLRHGPSRSQAQAAAGFQAH
jgi:hypothetical protein